MDVHLYVSPSLPPFGQRVVHEVLTVLYLSVAEHVCQFHPKVVNSVIHDC
jgi:hypothetical protein